MHWSNDDQGAHIYNLFAVLENAIVKVSYEHDAYNNKIVQNVTTMELYDYVDQYDGFYIRAAVTVGDFVVSCADCKTPAVKWYDHDLNLLHTEE